MGIGESNWSPHTHKKHHLKPIILEYGKPDRGSKAREILSGSILKKCKKAGRQRALSCYVRLIFRGFGLRLFRSSAAGAPTAAATSSRAAPTPSPLRLLHSNFRLPFVLPFNRERCRPWIFPLPADRAHHNIGWIYKCTFFARPFLKWYKFPFFL